VLRKITYLVVGSLAAVAFAMVADDMIGEDWSQTEQSTDESDVIAKRGQGKSGSEALRHRSRSRLVRNANGRSGAAVKGRLASSGNAGSCNNQAQSVFGQLLASPPNAISRLCTLQLCQIRLQV
jgi:hypothetical protein